MTVVATPTWLSAAITPRPASVPWATRASTGPYETRARAVLTMSYTARPMDAATTTITQATNALGSQCTTPAIRSLTGFGPKTPKPSWSANSRTA